MGNIVIDLLEKHYPGIRSQVEAIDVSTPVTAKRYTGNEQGSIMAWVPFSESEEVVEDLLGKHKMQLPGLQNFYMAGQWVSLGGLIRASSSGRHVIQYVCNHNKQKFKAFAS